METIKGTVSRVVFSSEETGYKVLQVRTPTGSPTIITGEFGPEIIPGTAANFHGNFKTHAKYGTQFRVTSVDITFNAEEQASIRLFIDSIAPQIGAERSSAITRHFQADTIRILDEEPERLQEVPGIGKVSARSLMEAWKLNRERWNKEREIYSLRAFLYSLGLKEKRVKRVLATFGGGLEAEEKIRQNPYSLTQVPGFGFTTVDFIAKQLGVPDCAPARFNAFVQYLIYEVCPSNGHLFLTAGEIQALATKYCQENSTTFLDKPQLLITEINQAVENLVQDSIVEVDGDCIYSPSNLMIEKGAAATLVNIMSTPSDLIFLNQQAVNEYIDWFEKDTGMTLSDEQRQALHYFVDKKVFIITGGPGTGKTTLLRAIVGLAQKMHLNLTCMTPTGISAKKLALTVGYEAFTIHRRLGYRGNAWVHNENNPYETDLAIIDEASMLDQEVLYRFLIALKPSTHIIFVGDQDQLPSVSAGNVLRELIGCGDVPTVKLEKIFRQDEASDIIKVAHKIRHGDSDLSLFKDDPKADVFFLRMKDVGEIETFVVNLARKFKAERRSFQIITPRNDGPIGVEPLNKALQEALNPESQEPEQMNLGRFILRRGDRVIVRKNDYELEVFNGDIGKVIAIGGGKISIMVDERIIEFMAEEAEEKLRLAYSLTVHRSQGQEYPYIVLPFINQFGRNMLQRNLLYTAITRAKEKVIVIGHGSALERAINNASVSRRNTKLGERISGCLQKREISSLQSLGPQVDSQIVNSMKEQSSSPEIELQPMDITES